MNLSDVEDSVGYINSFNTDGITTGPLCDINRSEYEYLFLSFLTTHRKIFNTVDEDVTFHYNPHIGFGICKYSGNSTAGRKISHPMDKKPRMMWIKSSSAENWVCYFDALTAVKAMCINLTNVPSTSISNWNNEESTETEITLGTSGGGNGSTKEYILYGWFGDDLSHVHSGMKGIENFSAITKFYHTNGTQTTIGLGFEPKLIILKNLDYTHVWAVFNRKRGWNKGLYLNHNSAEGTPSSDDWLFTEIQVICMETANLVTSNMLIIAFSDGMYISDDDTKKITDTEGLKQPYIPVLKRNRM